jgi:UTP--glucose-1-phosphate uridylyltransferase
MGCVGPKSLIEVRNGMSFLEFSIRQLEHLNAKYNVSVPIILMNSFNTEKDTKEFLTNLHSSVEVFCFNQFELPRMDAETMLPADLSADQQYYPPGHGYVYECLKRSDVVPKLQEKGIDWIFISNADNLGAVLDPSIASWC